jgi:hypothetical protein
VRGSHCVVMVGSEVWGESVGLMVDVDHERFLLVMWEELPVHAIVTVHFREARIEMTARVHVTSVHVAQGERPHYIAVLRVLDWDDNLDVLIPSERPLPS